MPTVVSSKPGNDKPLLAVNDEIASPCPDLVCVAWHEQTVTDRQLHVACSPSAQQPWLDQVVTSGAAVQGQGTKTILAQITADILGVDIGQISVELQDTDKFPLGMGAVGSRTAASGTP